MNKHRLTNKDIADNYLGTDLYLSISDFKGAFACWATRQDESRNYDLVAKAIKAYSDYLLKVEYFSEYQVVYMTTEKLRLLTSEGVFKSIPEVLALNEIEGKDFVCLGALSRNVFYHILREYITQDIG